MLNCIYHFTWYWTALAASIWLWLQKSPDWRSALVFLYKGGMPNIAVWPPWDHFGQMSDSRLKPPACMPSPNHSPIHFFYFCLHVCNGKALQITSLTVKLRNCWETQGIWWLSPFWGEHPTEADATGSSKTLRSEKSSFFLSQWGDQFKGTSCRKPGEIMGKTWESRKDYGFFRFFQQNLPIEMT